MSCVSTCRVIPCAPTEDVPHYTGKYSLQSGVIYENLLISVPSPAGGFYYVPPGEIVINLPPGATAVTYQGCQSTVSLPIPAGSTPDGIQAIVNQVMQQVAAQSAICNSPANPHSPPGSPSPFPPTTYANDEISVGCSNGGLMKQIGDLPAGVTFSIENLSIISGVFSSFQSVADANSKADDFLQSLIGSVVQCGWYNTLLNYSCPNTEIVTIDADTYFSTISQADADSQATAAAAAACPACSIAPSSLPDMKNSVSYSQQLTTDSKILPGWTIISGTLPTGVTMDTNGLISGTPTENVNRSISLTVQIGTCQKTYTFFYTGIIGPDWKADMHWTSWNTQMATNMTFDGEPVGISDTYVVTTSWSGPSCYGSGHTNNTPAVSYSLASMAYCKATLTLAGLTVPLQNGHLDISDGSIVSPVGVNLVGYTNGVYEFTFQLAATASSASTVILDLQNGSQSNPCSGAGSATATLVMSNYVP